MFIDHTQIDISAGNGGAGAVSFRREKFIPKGGPDGGDGGRGGHVIFIVDTNLHTLQDIRYRRRYKAENGHSGRGSNKTGKNGKDVIILVPAGSIAIAEPLDDAKLSILAPAPRKTPSEATPT